MQNAPAGDKGWVLGTADTSAMNALNCIRVFLQRHGCACAARGRALLLVGGDQGAEDEHALLKGHTLRRLGEQRRQRGRPPAAQALPAVLCTVWRKPI